MNVALPVRRALRAPSSSVVAALALLAPLVGGAGCLGAAESDPESAPAEAEEAGTKIEALGTSTCAWLTFSPEVSAFPAQTDPNALYATVALRLDPARPVRLVVRGAYAKANYSSYVVYDEHGAFHDGLVDADLEPDPGSTNPYRPGSYVLAPRRDYTLELVSPGVAPIGPNAVALPAGTKAFVTLRVYAAFAGGESGGPLPTAEFRDARTGAPVTCPAIAVPELEVPPALFPAVPGDGAVNFFRAPPSPFPNGNAGYLMTSLDPSKVAVVHLPRVPATFREDEVRLTTRFSTPETRYLSLGSFGESPNHDHVVNGSGLQREGAGAYFVVGPAELRAAVEAAGLNFLPLSLPGRLGVMPYVIYRNAVPAPGFAGAFENVALYPGPLSQATPAYHAQNYIGDYAPRGRQCTRDELFANGCGYPVVAQRLATP